MYKAVSTFAVSAVAAATGIALLATPAANADPQPVARVTFSVSGHSLVGTASGLRSGSKTCTFQRSVRDRQMPTGSIGGDSAVPIAERRSTSSVVTLKSSPLSAGTYRVRFFCLADSQGGTRAIIADDEGTLRVTAQPQNQPATNNQHGQNQPAAQE